MHAGRRGSARYMQNYVKVTMWHLMDSESPLGHNRIDGCDKRATYIFIIKRTDCWPPKQGQQAKVIYSVGLSVLALTLYFAVLRLTSNPLGTREVLMAYHCYKIIL